MTPTQQILTALGVLFGPLLAYVIANRRLSGKINTSEASSLWAESANMRVALQSQLDAALLRVTSLEARTSAAEERSNALQARNIALDRQALDYQTTISQQRTEIDELKRQVHDLQELVKTLQEAA